MAMTHPSLSLGYFTEIEGQSGTVMCQVTYVATYMVNSVDLLHVRYRNRCAHALH